MTANDFPTLLELVQRELLLFGAFWLLVGALDDLLIDLIWISRRIYRRFAYYRQNSRMTASELPAPSTPGLLAVFVPTWQEQAVIGSMLRQALNAWGNSKNFRIYVGCYPNDPAGIAAVEAIAQGEPGLRPVLCSDDGPTTKGDCLNQLWRALLADEMNVGQKAKAIILHDAEDSVHALELHIFDRLIEKASAVQLPVIPVPTASSRWISGHYCDEFAEAHGKTLVAREALGAALPLAGVACAIERNMLGRIALENGGRPFNAQSLTEDYELGLRIGASGGRTILARMADDEGNLVGSRAHFPASLDASVRQKTRWLTGIALAGWDRLRWRGSLAQKWMLLHDRRSIFAAIVLLVAYACIALTGVLALLAFAGLHSPSRLSPALLNLLYINAVFFMWRLAVRAAFVQSLYGWTEAAMSVPRSLIANIIAILAARRACGAYMRHCFGAPLRWDKTAHDAVPAYRGQND